MWVFPSADSGEWKSLGLENTINNYMFVYSHYFTAACNSLPFESLMWSIPGPSSAAVDEIQVSSLISGQAKWPQSNESSIIIAGWETACRAMVSTQCFQNDAAVEVGNTISPSLCHKTWGVASGGDPRPPPPTHTHTLTLITYCVASRTREHTQLVSANERGGWRGRYIGKTLTNVGSW